MELKHRSGNGTERRNHLLIVLNGIETGDKKNRTQCLKLLIVLNGIETDDLDKVFVLA